MSLEETLKQKLGCKELNSFGYRSGSFRTFETDNLGKVFVKIEKDKDVARPMFEGEVEGLRLLRSLNLPNVTIAKTYMIVDLPYMIGGACLVMDYLHTESLDSSARQADLGTALAHIHLHNARMKKEQPDKYVSKFGFHMPTYCGRIPYDNTWKDKWVDFIINNRLAYQIELLRPKADTNEAVGLWDFKLKPFIHRLFENVTIEPALLHGDFWAGNGGQKIGGDEAFIYDPSVFYGHHEYDLAIASMFPGFRKEFYDAYHKLIPKSPGFEKRERVYQLFHWLNHWNQYGCAYHYETTNLMLDICLSLGLRGVNYRKIEDDYADYNRMKENKKPIWKRTKNPNKMALFNTTRNRGRYANQTKTTTRASTRSRTTWISTTKTYAYDSEDITEAPFNGTTLSHRQIYQIFYAQEGFDWLKRRK